MENPLAYLICRVYYANVVSGMDEAKKTKMMMDLFVAEFSASREDLTPFNDQISAFFSNRIIPVLKTLPASYGKTPEFSSHMKQMLDLKDVYKIFERC